LLQGTTRTQATGYQVNAAFLVLGNTPESEQNVTVLDTGDAATAAIAKQFKNAYTIDPNGDTLYVVHDGELSVLRFDRPISRDAELFEQMLDDR
jgi:hypothetical protein